MQFGLNFKQGAVQHQTILMYFNVCSDNLLESPIPKIISDQTEHKGYTTFHCIQGHEGNSSRLITTRSSGRTNPEPGA
jgi:hypothetical protein